MVFARTKMVLEDNCFEEEPGELSMKFIGPHITKLYPKMYDLMRTIFGVPDSDIQESTSSWSKGKPGIEKFKIRWWLHKDMDIFSYLYIRFDLSAEGNGEGSAKVGIRPLLRTEYPQDTIWQRSLFYEMMRTFWHRIFYFKRREYYAEECRRSTVLMMDRLREFFNELKAASAEEEKKA